MNFDGEAILVEDTVEFSNVEDEVEKNDGTNLPIEDDFFKYFPEEESIGEEYAGVEYVEEEYLTEEYLEEEYLREEYLTEERLEEEYRQEEYVTANEEYENMKEFVDENEFCNYPTQETNNNSVNNSGGTTQNIEELNELRARASSLRFDLNSFKGNDKKTAHFTGLPSFTSLKLLYDFVEKRILVFSSILSKEQVFILVLMRLRLNMCFTTLSYLFQVSVTTLCKYFYSGLYSLYEQLKLLIKWPSHYLLEKNMPPKFKKTFNGETVTSIIDCFEIFTEKPGCKDALVKMYSNYKHHYTTKLLISITPFGSVSFISKPYSGRTSDKQVTETCGYMDQIQENDLILADRGFTIQKVVLDKGATLRVPDSSSRKKQLSSMAVERTRSLASVRNEIERTIGALRGKYEILNGPIPITMLNHEHNNVNVLEMVVTVCCALINLCPPIIK